MKKTKKLNKALEINERVLTTQFEVSLKNLKVIKLKLQKMIRDNFRTTIPLTYFIKFRFKLFNAASWAQANLEKATF